MKQALGMAALAALFAAGCQELPDLAPTASFVYSPISPIYAGQTPVNFDASASQDGDGRIVQFGWTFGDGSSADAVGGPVTTHVFPASLGCVETVVTVQLTVTDDAGQKGFASQRVSVQPAPGAPGCAGR